MPTLLSHPAVPIAVGLGLGLDRVPGPLIAAGVAASILPDADVIGFRLGIPYASVLGHRGFTHSLAFALCAALLAAALHRWLRARATTVFAFVLLAGASHGLLDAFTDGGLGVALWWPFHSDRWFAPVRPIRVAPLGLGALPLRGPRVLLSELRWIWGPALLLGTAAWAIQRGGTPSTVDFGPGAPDTPEAFPPEEPPCAHASPPS